MDAILLVPRRRADLEEGHPDYLVWAGEQEVGRIYRKSGQTWFWGITTLMYDATVGVPLHGFALDMEEAKAMLRQAFEAWLAWAAKLPAADLKFPRVDQQLRKMGAR